MPRFRRVYISAVIWTRERKDKKSKKHHIWTEEEAGRGTSGQSNHLFFLNTPQTTTYLFKDTQGSLHDLCYGRRTVPLPFPPSKRKKKRTASKHTSAILSPFHRIRGDLLSSDTLWCQPLNDVLCNPHVSLTVTMRSIFPLSLPPLVVFFQDAHHTLAPTSSIVKTTLSRCKKKTKKKTHPLGPRCSPSHGLCGWMMGETVFA